jgi:hypothetical protein
MSRDAGTTLDERLITYLAGGGAVIVARVVDGFPVCALARGTAATEGSASFDVFGTVEKGDRVSVHTLGETICAIAGDVVDAQGTDGGTAATLSVIAVKDDRPPGLSVVPFAFLDDDTR